MSTPTPPPERAPMTDLDKNRCSGTGSSRHAAGESGERGAAVTERPIIFSASMVRAILAGRKTMTRRLATSPLAKCVPGDRLWVRETLKARNMDLLGSFGLAAPLIKVDPTRGDLCISYAADGEPAVEEAGFDLAWQWERLSLPSIHMPRWASRITLEVTAVKIERLQEISEEDAIAEGISWSDVEEGYHTEDCANYHASDPTKSFEKVWWQLHPTGSAGAWEANPEVVAISFAVDAGGDDR